VKKDKFKSGYVALLGKPNVGKSTILNYFLKQKLSIISSKPQTTRDNICGILSEDNYQIVFIDTPGIHRPRTVLGKHMISQAKQAYDDADEVMVIVDAKDGITRDDIAVFKMLESKQKKKYKWSAVLINKTDLIKKQELLPIIDTCRKYLDVNDYIPVSGLNGENLNIVWENIIKFMPFGPAYYPQEQLTDKNERYITAEMIREQVLKLCRQEIPHSVAVEVNLFKQNPGRKTLIEATVFTEHESQKKIIIGKGASMLKSIGCISRGEIEKFLDRKVYLKLWVKVKKNWREDPDFLQRLGYH